MSCKSALYAVNSTAQIVPVDGTINFGSIVRRFGQYTNISGGNIIFSGSGYYEVDANFTVAASAAGTVTIQLFKDGVEIPGAIASMAAANGATVSLTIPVMVRQTCCCESTITAKLTGVGGTFSNAAVVVKKL